MPADPAAALRGVLHPSGKRRALPQAAALTGPVLTKVSRRCGPEELRRWTADGGKWTSTGTAVFQVGPRDEEPRAVLRMSATGAHRLRYESRVLATLAQRGAPAELRPMLPVRWAEGAAGRWWYVLDEQLGGVGADAAVAAEARLRKIVVAEAIRAAVALHRATAAPVVVDDALLRRWVDGPVDALAELFRHWPGGWVAGRLARLRRRLRQDLAGRRVHVGWVHGDFWLGNILVDSVTGAATGVVDWDCAGPRELPALDLLHLAFYQAAVEQEHALGALVADSLANGTWSAAVEEVVGHARWSWSDGIDDTTVVLLYWLRYVVFMSRQQQDHVEHSVLAWRFENVLRVLRCL